MPAQTPLTTYTPHPSPLASTLSQISLHHSPLTQITILKISRPSKNNAFTSVMEHEMVNAFEMLDKDEGTKCIVVTGDGRNFCAGADLVEGLERTVGIGRREHRDGGGRVALAIHRCRKPTIAAINGAAIGIGITMTLPMTIRISLSTAKIGFVFSQRGVVMEAASSFFLPRLIGHSRALYLTTTGSVLPANSKHFGALFNELVDEGAEGGVLGRALEVAEGVVRRTSTVSTYLCREMMWRGPGSAEGAHLLDSELMWELYEKEDKKEGIKAFLEKREPKMRGDLKEGMPANVPWWEPIDTRPRSGERTEKSRL